MAGSLAEAKWGVPEALEIHVWERLPQKMREVLEGFEQGEGIAYPGRT
jgi:hypothetical protein